MKLVWTYDSEVRTPVSSVKDWDAGYVETRRKIMLNYYLTSITKAKEFGYYTIIYCNPPSSKYFKGIVDEIIEIVKYEDTPLWDGIKTYPIETRRDEYCLIDGDVLLHKPLPKFTNDIVFDTWEIGNFEKDYKTTIDQLDSMGIKDLIPEWSPNKQPIASSGFMYLNNDEFRELYVTKWKIFNNFIKQHVNILNTFESSIIAGQFLFTLLLKHYNYDCKPMCEYMGEENEFYIHYFGGRKFKNPITKWNKYIDEKDNAKKILI